MGLDDQLYQQRQQLRMPLNEDGEHGATEADKARAREVVYSHLSGQDAEVIIEMLGIGTNDDNTGTNVSD